MEIDKERITAEMVQLVNAMELRYYVMTFLEECERVGAVRSYLVHYNRDFSLEIKVNAPKDAMPMVKARVNEIMRQQCIWRDE